MINKKVVLECINVLMFNGKTISNTEHFKNNKDGQTLWKSALDTLAKILSKWAEDNAVTETMFKEVTEDCKKLSGVEWRYITTNLYDEALKLTQERLSEENKPKETFTRPAEPSHGEPISPEINLKVIIPWWRRVQRRGDIMAYMPTEEQINWMANKLNLNAHDADVKIVIQCFLNDYKYAKENNKALLTKISAVNGKAILSYVGG